MLKAYFDYLSADLTRESDRIRQFFATHRPSAGTNREDLVAKFLKSHILPTVGVETGLVLSSSGELSSQADIVLVDALSNGPLGVRPIPLWLIEAVYGVIEVKTQLTPDTLKDSVNKCLRLKGLKTNFADSCGRQKIEETLFCIWSFEASKDLTHVKTQISDLLTGIPQREQPDFIVVPGRFLVRGGHYFDISTNGQPNSLYRQMRLKKVGDDPDKLLEPPLEMLDLGVNTLITFLHWLNSWLYAAGPRRPDMVQYYPIDDWGTKV
jgi:hypothetical protein